VTCYAGSTRFGISLQAETVSEAIHELRPDDAPELARIIEESRALAEYPIGPNWSTEQIETECRTGLGLVLKTAAGQTQAFIIARDIGAAIEISFLATASDARGHGRMARLIRELTARLPAGKAIWLEVHEANAPARRLYERCGFESVGKRPKYYADGGTAVLYNYG
jgi:ribosomal-protein-alanine N-acetyltransferase